MFKLTDTELNFFLKSKAIGNFDDLDKKKI